MECPSSMAGAKRISEIATASLLFLLCTGCSWVGDTIKSELSAYAEPTGGDLAHVRLVGSRNVKVYPGSTCAGSVVPGGGYPAGPQMGGQRKRDLGMPKSANTPKHFVEIAARAGEPITAAFSFYDESYRPGVAGTGAPGTRQTSSCYVARSFVPEPGENYEVVAGISGGNCPITVARLVRDASDGTWRRVPVPSEAAPRCPG